MASVFDPDTAGLDTFTLGRDPDKGSPTIVDDPGQLVTRSDGGQVWVFQRAQRVRRYAFAYTGLRQAEWLALDRYIETVLADSLEPFSFTYAGLTALDDMRLERRPQATQVRPDAWDLVLSMRQEVTP